MKKVRLLLCVGLFVALISSLSGCSAKKAINLNDYIKVCIEGYDTLGQASYAFDWDALKEDYGDKVKLNSKKNSDISSADLMLSDSALDYLIDFCIDMEFNKKSELSNGDKVILKWNCMDEVAEANFNYRLKHSDIEQTVSGLKKVDTFDPFTEMEYEISGIDPLISISLKQNYDKKEMQYISFSVNQKDNLKNGDTVTVTASVQGTLDDFIEKFGCMPSPLEKEIEVKDMPTYVSSADQLPDDVISKCKELTNEALRDSLKNWYEENKFLSADYLGYYFMSGKENLIYGKRNMVYFLYNVNCTIVGEETTYVFALRFDDIYKSKDGKIDIETLEYEVPDSVAGFGENSWIFGWDYETAGYNSLDIFNDTEIISRVDSYEYEKVME